MTADTRVAIADAHTRLERVFVAALELTPEADHSALAYRETPQWDSVAHMQLVIALESEFDVMLETDDVLALSTFAEAVSILRKHGIAF